MGSILFGNDSALFIHQFSSQLKQKTQRLAEELDDRQYERYSPWLCLRPLVDEPIDPELLDMTPLQVSLITDSRQLSLIDRFLCGQGKVLMEDMPVKPSEWPVMVDISHSRPDAISAFHEGRALLKCSPFLEKVFPDLVEFVVPQDREKPSGFDTAYARGVVFRTFPRGRTGLLAGFQLAHAMGHQAAIMLQSADPLIQSDPQELIHYSVRNDQRTANHAIVSAVALGYMVILMRDIYEGEERPLIDEEHVSGYADFLPDAVRKAVDSIAGSCELTALGSCVLEDLSALAS